MKHLHPFNTHTCIQKKPNNCPARRPVASEAPWRSTLTPPLPKKSSRRYFLSSQNNVWRAQCRHTARESHEYQVSLWEAAQTMRSSLPISYPMRPPVRRDLTTCILAPAKWRESTSRHNTLACLSYAGCAKQNTRRLFLELAFNNRLASRFVMTL